MAASGYSITISAVDRASQQIAKINRQIAAVRAPVDRVQRELYKFGRVSGLTSLTHGMRDLEQRSLGAFRSVGRIAAPLSAITSAASVAGMMSLVSAWSQFGVATSNTARRLGVSIEELQGLQGAAMLSGSSAEALTSGLETLGQTLYDAVGGRAPQAVVMLNTLGISFEDAAGHARSVSAVLPELADKIASMTNPYDQMRAASALLGGAAREMLPFLIRGSAGIAEYNALALHYGVVSEAGAAAARSLQYEQTKLTLATRGLSNSIAEALAPTLGPLMGDLAEWIARSPEAADGVKWLGREVSDLGDYLRSIHWKDDAVEINRFAHEVNDVVQAFGGWKPVIEGIIALKLLGWVTGLLGPLATLIRLLSLIPGSGVAVTAGAVGLGGYLGFKGAVRSSTNSGRAAELGLTPSSLPGSVDEWGNVNLYAGPGGKTYTQDDVDRMYAAKHGGASPPPSLGSPGPSASDKSGRAKQAVEYFKSQGWSGQAAAALAGGIQGESGFDPRAAGDRVNGVPTAFGLGEWHMDRVNKILGGAGIDVRTADYAQQLQAMQWELTHTEKAAGEALRRAHDIPDASRALVTTYERSADQGRDTALRSVYAQNIYEQYGADAPAQIADGTGAAPADVTHTVKGDVGVRVNLGGNIPTGTTIGANASGDLFRGAPQIHRSMQDAG